MVDRIAIGRRYRGCWAAALAIFIAAPFGSAATIAEYQFQGGGGAASATSDANDAATVAGVGISVISTSMADLMFEDNNTTLVQSGSVDDYTWFTRGSNLGYQNDPIASGQYLQFTITPTGGVLSLETLTAVMGASKGGIANDVTWSLIVRSSLDTFASDIGTLSHTGGVTGPPVWQTHSLDLSTLSDITDPITFRLYLLNTSASNSNSSKYMILDTVTLTGSFTPTAVPTPAALPMGLGLLAAAGLRRRSR